jgi:hypothetical protein
MMRRLSLLVVPFLAFALAQPASAQGRTERRAAEKASRIPDGEPVDCILISQILQTRVLDDQTIDFVMRNGDVFRNTLPNRCPQLGFEEAFGYQTSIPQLCSVDIITVVQTGGGPRRGASCGLGRFQPTKSAEAQPKE